MNNATLDLLRQRKAASGFLTAEESFVSRILESRAAGLTRQKTTKEIAAMYCTTHHAWKCAENH